MADELGVAGGLVDANAGLAGLVCRAFRIGIHPGSPLGVTNFAARDRVGGADLTVGIVDGEVYVVSGKIPGSKIGSGTVFESVDTGDLKFIGIIIGTAGIIASTLN